MSLLIPVSVAVSSGFRCQASKYKSVGKGRTVENTRSWQLLLGFVIKRSGEARLPPSSSRKVLELHFFVKLPNEVDKEPDIFKVLWVSTETSYKFVPAIAH